MVNISHCSAFSAWEGIVHIVFTFLSKAKAAFSAFAEADTDNISLCCCAIATEHDNNPTANIHFILFFMLYSFFNYYKDSIY